VGRQRHLLSSRGALFRQQDQPGKYGGGNGAGEGRERKTAIKVDKPVTPGGVESDSLIREEALGMSLKHSSLSVKS